MRLLITLWVALMTWAVPAFALASEEFDGGYRGIATIYYTLMWVILTYGLYDSFGKQAMYVGAPVLAIVLYFMLPAS